MNSDTMAANLDIYELLKTFEQRTPRLHFEDLDDFENLLISDNQSDE